MAQNYEARLKDEFFLAAQVRPAAPEHYIAWLEAWLESGKTVDYFFERPFADEKFFTVSADATLPQLPPDISFNILVPPGVNVAVPNNGNSCSLYFFDGPGKVNGMAVSVWREMLDTLIADGYELSRLVSSHGIRCRAQEEIINRVSRLQLERHEFYEAFDKLGFTQIDEELQKLRALTADEILRGRLRLDAKTPIDAKALDIVEYERKEAIRVLEVLHYKSDPAHQEPIKAFPKRRKRKDGASADEPDIELADNLQVGPPIKYKDPGPK